MLTARLVQMIETHADALAREALKDIETNPRTPSFRRIPRDELEARVVATYRNLGSWMQSSSDDAVRAEYEDWGRRRFREGVLVSEIVYTLILIKHHLRRFIRDHGAVEFSGDPGPSGMIGVHLHGIQELNYMVGEFFDRALYHLARGYEAEALASEGVTPAR
jgi:hypothetical protein